MRASWLYVAIGGIGLSLVPGTTAQAQTCTPTSLEVIVRPIPPDDECHRLATLEHVAAYSWQLFIALNWPAASGKRGVPDGDDPKRIADRTGPRVWETWKSLQETFIAGGHKPGKWDDPETHAFCANSDELDPSPSKVLVDINQSGFAGQAVAPLIAQNRTYVRYEVRMRRVGYEKIVEHLYYTGGAKNI